MKSLVIYYSFEGNTKYIASNIAEILDSDLVEIKTEKELIGTHGFMKYFWGGKKVLMNEKPEIEDINVNFDDYDLIFIGTPVWAFTYTPPLNTFFEKYKIQGKNIVIFCCHGGNKKNTLEKMKIRLVGNEIVGELDFYEPTEEVIISKKLFNRRMVELLTNLENILGGSAQYIKKIL
ncbi:MAG: flavodoxin [Candidatus Gracilibacteria bacterium]|nr:flavodoxin [Candidatus Gracilibacteria bacterium]